MTEAPRLSIAEIRAADAEMEARAAQCADRLKAGTQSPGATAVAGYNGHLFIGLGTNRWESHYEGRVDIDATWFEAWATLLEGRQAEARRRGVQLWNLVVPEKQVVLPEQRWAEPPSPDRRPFQQLLDRVAPDHRMHYARDALAAAKPLGPVYHVRNSHWCAAGCLAVTADLTRLAGGAVDIEAQRFAYQRGPTPHDLPPHFLEEPREVEHGYLVPNGPYLFHHQTLPETGRHQGSRFCIQNPDAPDARRVAIFGDSFSYHAGLAAALSALFVEVAFLWSKSVIWEFADAQRADLVIWESAERFMVTLPKA